MAERWFTPDELSAMGTRTLDALLTAIDSGEVEDAKKLAQRMYNEFLSQHDGYRNWTTALLSEIGRRFGDEVLDTMMVASVKAWWLPNLDTMAQRAGDDRRAKVKMLAAGLRGHLQPMDVTEDDEKVVIRMTPCGSGGRMVLEGKYEGADAFYNVPGPSKMTYGRRDFPVYCAHEAAMEEIDMDANGQPFVVVEPGERLGRDHCGFVIYKNPDDVPDKYYKRLGRKRPEVDRTRLIASVGPEDE
jgi:hypothetical protein